MRSMRSGGAFAFFGYAHVRKSRFHAPHKVFWPQESPPNRRRGAGKSLYRIVMSTPRAKPMVAKEGGSAPATKDKKADGAKKKAKPKGSAPTAPVGLGMPMNK